MITIFLSFLFFIFNVDFFFGWGGFNFVQIPVNKVQTYSDLRNVLMKRIFLSALHFRINTRYKVGCNYFCTISYHYYKLVDCNSGNYCFVLVPPPPPLKIVLYELIANYSYNQSMIFIMFLSFFV